MKHVYAGLVTTVALMLLATSALATSGTVTGRFLFFQNQGNFCPTSRNCTGAKYPQSWYQQNGPIIHTKVFLRRSSDNVILGQGTTDLNGSFTISWSDPSTNGHVEAQLIWVGENKDGYFAIRSASGAQWVFTTPHVLLRNDASQPANLGTKVWGTTGAPNALANVYDGAARMWLQSLSQSNRMLTMMGGLEIRAFDDSCPTSCADGPANIIKLDSGSPYSPQNRVMHEMGHIASYRASRDGSFCQPGGCMFYSWPNGDCAANGGWDLTSREWEAAAFEEAIATHFADVALYHPNAVTPHTCLSSSACGTGSFNIETSFPGGCIPVGQGLERMVLSHIRYHWDNYDSVDDGNDINFSRGVWEALDTLHAFDNGPDNRQKNESHRFGCVFVDDLDGRSPKDFLENWSIWGTSSHNQYNQNCGSAGD
jgi:hypothetical protein